jgi:protein-L-isoaspartate(D-aspartate) O-methyltransferase
MSEQIHALTDSEYRSQTLRKFFAAFVTANAGAAQNTELKAAFASTPRERFLGKGPWKVVAKGRYVDTPSDDPAFIYVDAAVALDPAAGINNGQPTLHAMCLAALDIQKGETITHIGAGTGYYTALLSKLTGPTGMVYAFELQPRLADRAKRNLAEMSNVTVQNCSGTEGALPPSDIVYVSAGATEPQSVWLGALRENGRLLFPLTPDKGAGAMLLIQRLASSDRYKARFLSTAMFIPCVGARDEDTAERLSEAFSRGEMKGVQSMRRGSAADESCCFAGKGWWLSSAP